MHTNIDIAWYRYSDKSVKNIKYLWSVSAVIFRVAAIFSYIDIYWIAVRMDNYMCPKKVSYLVICVDNMQFYYFTCIIICCCFQMPSCQNQHSQKRFSYMPTRIKLVILQQNTVVWYHDVCFKDVDRMLISMCACVRVHVCD